MPVLPAPGPRAVPRLPLLCQHHLELDLVGPVLEVGLRRREAVARGRAFEEIFSPTVIERRVRRYLKLSRALERFWGITITAEDLQAELERMVAASAMPERLRELFTALDNDPVMIQECLDGIT